MKLRLHLIFVLASISVTVNYAAPSLEAYWKTSLPNTTMPQSLRDLLPSENNSGGRHEEMITAEASKNKWNGKPSETAFGNQDFSLSMGSDGISVDTGSDGNSFSIDPFEYSYAASKDQLQDNPNTTLFFLEQDLNSPAKKMSLHFTKSMPNSKFLKKEISDTIPFSSLKFPEIMNLFSIESNSTEAKLMRKTIEKCEEPDLDGEEKYCATSLEAMIDFSTSKLKNKGSTIQVLTTQILGKESHQNYNFKKEFRIEHGVNMIGDDDHETKIVVCHRQRYVYPVFYCHVTHKSRAYVVPLIGSDRLMRVKAVAICHLDTFKWNPNHLAFQLLGVKPGTVTICHFLPQNHVVWVA